VPRLAGQHYRYLLAQLNASAQRNDNAHAARIRGFSTLNREAVADYLSRVARPLVHGH
jgi:cytochrome c553